MTDDSNSKPALARWTVILAAFGILISLAWNLYNLKRIEDVDFENMSIEQRPILKIVGEPQIVEVRLGRVKEVTDTIPDAYRLQSTGNIPYLMYRKYLKIELRVTNVGRTVAEIIQEVWTDSSTDKPIIRRRMLDPFQRKQLFDSSFAVEMPYNPTEVLPGDTIPKFIDLQIGNNRFSTFTIHYYLLYKNQREALYDTYVWMQFDAPTMLIIRNKRDTTKVAYEIDQSRLPKPVRSTTSSHFYKRDESSGIIAFVEAHKHIN
jgi:hypothetical protein